MRPALVLSLSTAATIVFVAGCTLLIPFDDVPNNGAAGDDDDVVDAGKKKNTSSSSGLDVSSSSSSSGGDTSSSSSSSGSASSSSGTTSTGIPPACDPAFDRTPITCGNYTRPNCGSEPGLAAGAAVDSDLIDCTNAAGGEPGCVRHCPHGCAQMPAGHNDSCDECFDKDDGWYCAKDLKGDWGPDNGMAVHCVGHKQIANAVCGQNKCATVCPPDGPSTARPSCCTP